MLLNFINKLGLLFICISFPLPTNGNPCPCSSSKLCSIVTKNYDKELVVFDSVDSDRWKNYNWTEISNVVLFSSLQNYSSIYCFAHQHSVRVTALVSVRPELFPKINNIHFRQTVVNNWVSLVQDYHLDGINIDIEGPAFTDDVVQGITSLTKEAYVALKKLNSSYLVTWDVPYSPFLAGCISGYCYDWASISNYSDYLIAMNYDATVDILFASANSPINLIKEGYTQYIEELNISPNKFVMAIPWYGYNYTCSRFYNHTGDNLCIIADASQSQVDLSAIIKLFDENIGGLKWDDKSKSPYFVIKISGLYHEIWFDNIKSLEIKFDLALSFGLKGLGMWRADALDYNSKNMNVSKFNSALWNSINYYVSLMKNK